MGAIKKPQKVKLICGFLISNKNPELFFKVLKILKEKFGNIDFESPEIDFNFTNYYKKELGDNPIRKFISFNRLIDPKELPKIKIYTNKIEIKFSKDSLRLVNIDPGYLDIAKLILASTKDYTHRIYIGSGIFAENTLFYQNDKFNPRDWTYPDYRSQIYIEIFHNIRKIYDNQIKQKVK